MNIRLAAYSHLGLETAKTIADVLNKAGHSCECYSSSKYADEGALPIEGGAAAWAKEGFEKADALIFCCASGIAVRAIAPWVRSKTTDPAIIVTDEMGHFIIPLLSGHIGGANELAMYIAEKLGAVPVVTTATDIHGLFAVDVFATKNHLKIKSMKLAKDVSAELLSGKEIGFESDMPFDGTLPKGLAEGPRDLGICISKDLSKGRSKETLYLVPQIYAAGLGCKKGKPFEELEPFFLKMLKDAGISVDEVRCIASIDLKKDEEGLLALSKKYKIPFICYSQEELNALEGDFSKSAFVNSVAGVDCVCERAAVAAGGKELIVRKTKGEGMTFALGKIKEEIRFE